MAAIQIPTTNTNQLDWDPRTRTFTGEISSTNGFGRVWDDACDEGMALQGKTRSITFVIVDEERDNEGDVQFWTLRPAFPSDASYDITVTLFND